MARSLVMCPARMVSNTAASRSLLYWARAAGRWSEVGWGGVGCVCGWVCGWARASGGREHGKRRRLDRVRSDSLIREGKLGTRQQRRTGRKKEGRRASAASRPAGQPASLAWGVKSMRAGGRGRPRASSSRARGHAAGPRAVPTAPAGASHPEAGCACTYLRCRRASPCAPGRGSRRRWRPPGWWRWGCPSGTPASASSRCLGWVGG